MAGNPDYCLTVDEWKERFLGWLTAPTPQALLRREHRVRLPAAVRQRSACRFELRSWLFGYTMDNRYSCG